MSTDALLAQSQLGELERTLRSELRGAVSFDITTRGIHAADASHYQAMPMCVVVPMDADDCVAALKIAHRFKLPVTPRGGGTSLSGQTFGHGMVIDTSKHMDQVLSVDADEQWAVVQPGVVRDRLNAQLLPHGLHFAPDPATGNRATIGGMIGNNTCGTRSMVYGKTIDHLISCRVALADGTVLELEPCDSADWKAKGVNEDRAGEIMRGIESLIAEHKGEIAERFPRVLRRVSGYNLDEFVQGAGVASLPRLVHETRRFAWENKSTWNLANLVVGSEGTLAFLLEAKARLTSSPKATALCIVHFDDLIESLRAVPEINTHNPSAVELLDGGTLRAAQTNPATRDLATFIEGTPDAVLITEFFGEDAEDAQARAAQFAQVMKAKGLGYAHPIRADARGQSDVWETRKLGLGLITNVHGPVKGQAFVEDACVPVEVLADYIVQMRVACELEGVTSSVYAHASVGVLHFRPAVDLHRKDHREKMQRIADHSFELVQGYGGSLAGEHGDGLVRGAYIAKAYGPRLYDAFKQVKALFDPGNTMNPGKIIDAPSMVDSSYLRYGERYRIAEVPANFSYRDQAEPDATPTQAFAAAVEQCNGVGACRKVGLGTMCPSYMATRDEEDSTRGRANALRMAMSGQLGDDDLTSDRIEEVLSLCLSCKACKTECPNAVDMSKLKADVTQMRYNKRGTPLGVKLIARMPDYAKWLAGPLAPLVNLAHKLPPCRWLLEKLTGLDRRRPMPAFARHTFANQVKRRAARTTPPVNGKVGLFVDTWSNFLEPHIALAAVELIESCGYEVVLIDVGDAQRPRLSKGLVHEAKRKGDTMFKKLDALDPALSILCLEHSDASALVDDLPDLIDDKALGRRIAARVKPVDVFLADQLTAGKISGFELAKDADQDILLHGHCHQKALFGTQSIHTILNSIDGVTCNEVDSGCCGMAGSFGYEHYELSQKIGEDRLFPAVRDAMQSGQTIVACGMSCRHQLRDFLKAESKHFVEIVRGCSD